MTTLLHLLRCRRAAAAAEFALVLPLLLLLLFGVIDAGRFLWEFNKAEKATQMGVRYAVVTDPVAQGLSTYSFAITDGIIQGNPVPIANFDNAACDSTTCTCTGGNVCGAITRNATAYNNIRTRMAVIYPPIANSNVKIIYKNVGLGFAGDPDNSNVSALVTVELHDLAFQPITCFVLCTIPMPTFSSALTLEDAQGAVSN
jgi:Flp pilus assembly protein TadG